MNTSQVESTGPGFRNITGPIDKTARGKLVFTNGAAMVRVFADINGRELYTAYFEGLIPEIKTSNGTVTVEYGYNFQFQKMHSPRGKILLNGFIPWDIVIHGWAYEVTFNLKELHLNRLQMNAAARDIELILPEPEHTVPVTITGGVSLLSISIPSGTETRLNLQDGVKDFSLNGKKFGKISATFENETPGYQPASNRYDIGIKGGASDIKIESY